MSEYTRSSQQKPAAKETREVARPAGNLHTKEAEAHEALTEAPSQRSNCGPSNVNKALTRPAMQQTRRTTLQTRIAKPGFPEVPANEPAGPDDHSTQMSKQPQAHASKRFSRNKTLP
ncbi:hypothetical protein Q8A73_007089 [Channa argus]|nr:hypothetical protein Q8A73_007089 [Channa argus]